MGKAKRFNQYDSDISETRKQVKNFGVARQNYSGITSSFRSAPAPPSNISGQGTSVSSGGDGKFLTASLGADQTANIGANDHIEFDTKDEDGGIVLQTGSGQADGIFELSSGTKVQLSAHLRPEFSGATGRLVIVWYDITNSAELGSRAIYQSTTHVAHTSDQPIAEIIVTPATNITVEVRIISVTALTALANEYCIANLFEISLGATGAGGSGSSGGSITFPITPTINDLSDTWSGTQTLNLSATNAHVTRIVLDQNLTLGTPTNPPSSGTQIEFEIEFVQDGTGGRTVTQWAEVAETVTISSTASTTTIITYRTNDGGTTYHAIPALRGSITLGTGLSATTALDNLASVAINTSLISDADDTDDLGSASNEWKDLFIDGTAEIDTANIGIAVIGASLSVATTTTLSGDITLGGSSAININFVGRANTDFIPIADNTHDLGTTTLEWKNLYIDGIAKIDSIDLDVGFVSDVVPVSGGPLDLGTTTDEWEDLWIDGVAHIDTLIVDVISTFNGTSNTFTNDVILNGTTLFNTDASLANTIDLLPATDLGSSLGSATASFSLGYFHEIRFDETTKYIQSSGALDIIHQVPAGGDIAFFEDGTAWLTLDGGNNNILFNRPIDMGNENISNVDTLDFNGSLSAIDDLDLLTMLDSGAIIEMTGGNIDFSGGDIIALADIEIDGAFNHDGTTVGFYGATPQTRQTIGDAGSTLASVIGTVNSITAILNANGLMNKV